MKIERLLALWLGTHPRAAAPRSVRAEDPPRPAAPAPRAATAPVSGPDEVDVPAVEVRRPTRASVSAPPPTAAVPAVRGAPERDPAEDLVLRSQSGVTLGALLDELVDELTWRLSREDPAELTPLAIRLVHLSPNLRASLGPTLEAKLTARLGGLPGFHQVVCVECRAVRSRVEGDDWVVTLGPTTQADLRRIARDIGAKTFMDVDVTFTQVPAELVLAARIYRASDGFVLWTAAYKGDETTAAILRTGVRPPSREEALAEVKRGLEQRPLFGYEFGVGVAYVGADGPLGGYVGANPMIRLVEYLGADRRHAFGFQGEGVIDFNSNHQLLAGVLSVGYFYSILPRNLHRPDLRLGVLAGGFIAGTDGSSAIFQLSAECVLNFRLTLSLAAAYMVPAQHVIPDQAAPEDLGGLGGTVRAAFTW